MSQEAAAIERLAKEIVRYVENTGDNGQVIDRTVCGILTEAYSLGISQRGKEQVCGAEFRDGPGAIVHCEKFGQHVEHYAATATGNIRWPNNQSEFERGISQERERCAKLVEKMWHHPYGKEIAAAIRNPDPTPEEK